MTSSTLTPPASLPPTPSSPEVTNANPPTSNPPPIENPSPPPPKNSLLLPLIVLTVIALLAGLFLLRSKLTPSPPASPTPSPSPISETDNPFNETSTPEDNAFDSVDSDGSVYDNPFDVLEDQATGSAASPSTNPFETLR